MSSEGDVQPQEAKVEKCLGLRSQPVNRNKIALGAWAMGYFPGINCHPRIGYGISVLVLTYLCYACYHMSRKPFSVVKSVLSPDCDNHTKSNASNDTGGGWEPFVGDHCGTLLGSVDYAWLFAYAIAMFFSGMIGDRLDLRYFLTIGLIGSGIGTALLGVAYYAKIHHLYYFILVQIFSGVLQSTGWPGVVAVMGNWFGKWGRGLLMGIWNSHTSVGNILGTLIPSIWAQPGEPWAWSFFVPGFITIGMGIIIFLFLVVDPSHVCLPSPKHHLESDSNGSSNASPTTTKSINNEKNIESQPLLSDDGEQVIFAKNASPVVTSPSHEQKAIGFIGALMIPGVIEYSLSLFFAKLVAYTFLFWLPFYVEYTKVDGRKLDVKLANQLSTLFDVGGIAGGISIGLLSDLFNSRAILCVIMLYLSIPSLFLYHTYGGVNEGILIVLLLFSGFCVNGPYAIITTAVSSDLGTHKSLKGNHKAKATVSAIIDGTGSIGAALGPFLTGWIQEYGWDKVFYLLMASCFMAALLLTRLVVSEVLQLWKRLRQKV